MGIVKSASPCILTINGGSSSIKFALFEVEDSLHTFSRSAAASDHTVTVDHLGCAQPMRLRTPNIAAAPATVRATVFTDE